MLTQEEKGMLKHLLEVQRDQLYKQVKELEEPIIIEDEPGPDDETDEAEAFSNRTAQAGGLRKELADVEDALERMDKGTYGICKESGREIPLDALEVNPALAYHPDVLKEINKKQ